MGRPRCSPILNTGFCEYCGAVLNQRDDEPYWNWIKRRTCNKSHSAFLRKRKEREIRDALNKARDTSVVIDLFKASGVIQYIPGTPEFNSIAALYA